MEEQEQLQYNLNEDSNTITIFQFDLKYLQAIQHLTKQRIVEFDLAKNKSFDVFSNLFEFIGLHSKDWKGLILNLSYQKKYLPKRSLKDLSNAIEQMQDLSVLKLSFGGYRVSKYYAQNHPKAHHEWERATNGFTIPYDSYKHLLEVFSKIISTSPNLKIFCLDFQGLGSDTQFMLSNLIDINTSLSKCLQLEEYILSLNHCQISNYYQKLTTFLTTFEFLKHTSNLRKFVLNISEWEFDCGCIEILGKIFGEYLPYQKHQFQNFQFDHSSDQEVDRENQNDTQIIVSGLQKLLERTRYTLKTFYLSLVNYKSGNLQLQTFKNIFRHLSACQVLQKLSIRIQNWVCTSIQIEEEFYKEFKQLKTISTLKQVHISTFTSMLRRLSPYFKYGSSLIQLIGQLNQVCKQNVAQQKIIQQELSKYYRPEILTHLYQICNPQDFNLENPKFEVTQYY